MARFAKHLYEVAQVVVGVPVLIIVLAADIVVSLFKRSNY